MMNQAIVIVLQRMFVDGATPSRLMQYIASKHEGDPHLDLLIKNYFDDAFAVPFLRCAVSWDNDYSSNSRHAHFNREVLPEMIQRIGDWNTGNLEGSWLGGVSVRSFDEEFERLKNTRFEELDRCWDTLTNDERLFIIRLAADNDYRWSVMKCLASLAERLQQKVVELEGQLKGPVV